MTVKPGDFVVAYRFLYRDQIIGCFRSVYNGMVSYADFHDFFITHDWFGGLVVDGDAPLGVCTVQHACILRVGSHDNDSVVFVDLCSTRCLSLFSLL